MTILRHRRLCIFFIAFCSTVTLYAQLLDYHIQLFDESHGLRTDMDQVIKDDHEFVWIIYQDRVQRFDGKQVYDFFIGRGFNSIFNDRDGNIWLTSISDVYRFENNKKGFAHIAIDSAIELTIGKVFQLPDKEVWVLTNLGFYAFDQSKSVFLPVTDEKFQTKIPVNTRRYSFRLSENTFFYSSKDTIWSQDMRTGSKLYLPFKNLSRLYALNKERLMISSWQGHTFLYDFQNQILERIFPHTFLKNIEDDFLVVNSVINLDEYRHLLATTKGLLEYNSTTGQFLLKKMFFKGHPISNADRIRDLHLDNHRKVWASSESTLMRFDPFGAGIGLIRNTETNPTKSFSNEIRGFAAVEKENLWMASFNGIIYWDLEKNVLQPYYAVDGAQDRLNHPSIRGISYDGENVIIGQTSRGIWLYNPVKRKYRRPVYEEGAFGESTRRKLENDFIDQVYKLHNGNHMIAARDGGYILEAGSNLIRQVDFPGSHENLNFSYEDNFKQVWIGTSKSIYCLDSNLVFKFSVSDGIGSGLMRCLLQWKDNEYILGAKGLYTVVASEDSITTRTLSHYFDNISIHSIYRDSSDRLWLATDQGLYRFTKETGFVENFDRFDNTQGDFFEGNSLYHNKDGMLFLGGTNGINYFYPDKIETRNDSLKITILNIMVNQNDTSYFNRASLLSLKPSQNHIEIEFIAPFYGNTNRVQYKYQLNGLSTAWKNIGHGNTIRFTSLRPGKYLFKVAASINGINWYEGQEPLVFHIAFPFWQTWWFIALSIGAIAGATFFLVKQRIRFIRRQEAERRHSEVQLITMNRDLAASQLTALRAQMNPHFIFNALNSIQRYILKGDVDQANKYLSKFSRLQREVLNNSSLDFISLDKEIEILDLYLQLEQSRFNENFTYVISVDDAIETNEIKIPPMILQPFVENAIWHGLMPSQGPKRVDIQFALNGDDQLNCRIQDNGIGRTASARLKNNQEATLQYKSKGMSLVHERLRVLEQLYQHPYQVEVIDRTDDTGVVEGTEVNVILFVGR